MEIIILGTGCAKCQQVYDVVHQVVLTYLPNATLTKQEDMGEILKYNTLTLPAIVVNNQVVLKGVVPSQEEVKSLLNIK